MIRVEAPHLDNDTARALAALQAEIDGCGTWSERSAAAKALWKHTTRWYKSPARAAVARDLASMCSGSMRCMYCEDSLSHQIEHVAPKSLYPGSTFVWSNLLYSCGACNGPKQASFAVFDAATGVVNHLNGSNEPPAGDPVLLNPRQADDDPFSFLELQLDTGRLVNVCPPGTRAWDRAEYTLGLLGLNTRDVLPKSRRLEYRRYLGVLEKYVRDRDPRDAEAIVRGSHRTVWMEMKRQRERYPHLLALFSDAPEALAW